MSTAATDHIDPPAHSRRSYAEAVLSAYRSCPGTTGHVRRSDRLFAGTLHDRGISLDAIRAAFVLATARRAFRPADAPPLQPIRSLYYFLPVINARFVPVAPRAPRLSTYSRRSRKCITLSTTR